MDSAQFDLANHLVWSRRHHLNREDRTTALYISNKLRLIADSGGARRDFEILARLTQEFDVHYIAVSPDHEEERNYLATPFVDCASVTLVGASAMHAPANASDRIARHAAPIARTVVADLIKILNPRVIHVNGYFLMQHVPPDVGLPIILQEENIEFELARDEVKIASERTPNTPHAKFGELEEISAWRRARHCIAVTKEDADTMSGVVSASKVHCLPNGLTRTKMRAASAQDTNSRPKALFVGNYSWAPSRDAAEYISRVVWPAVRERANGAEIELAGAGADDQFSAMLASSPGVFPIGQYTEFGDLVSAGTVFVSPLRFGGGNKMKLVEALGAGLPIVASSETLRGFPDQVHNCVAVCNTTDEFANATALLLSSEKLRIQASSATRRAAFALPSWDEVAGKVGDLWRAEAEGQASV